MFISLYVLFILFYTSFGKLCCDVDCRSESPQIQLLAKCVGYILADFTSHRAYVVREDQ